jgi:phospholipid transport system substrate-binding protein
MNAQRQQRAGRWLVFSLLALLCLPAASWAGAPTDSLRGTIDQVLAVLRSQDLGNDAKKQQIRGLISARFDYRAMSQSTLAQNWKTASPQQQERFVELYARMMQDTYLVLVEVYRDQEVAFGEETIRKDKYAEVDTAILDHGKQIPVQYKLRLKEDGWYVYDVIIEGISMVSNYRSSYQQIVRADGMDGLIAKIEEKLRGAAE